MASWTGDLPSVYCLIKRLQRDSSPAFRAEAESSHYTLTTPPAVPSSAREPRPEPGKVRICPSRTSLLLIFSSKKTNEQVLAEDLPGARRCGVTTSLPQLPSEGFSSETKRLEPGQDQLGVMSAEGGAVCSNCRMAQGCLHIFAGSWDKVSNNRLWKKAGF